jgi:hypothetical protein
MRLPAPANPLPTPLPTPANEPSPGTPLYPRAVGSPRWDLAVVRARPAALALPGYLWLRGFAHDGAHRPRQPRRSRWSPRGDGAPNLTGAVTIERALPANTRLWLTGWTKTIPGGEVVSLLVEIADKGGRPRQ